MEPATIVMTIPKKRNDATTYTSVWAEQMYKMAKSLGYNVIAIRGSDNTYNNVSKSLEKYRPRLYIHVGHGCPSHINGQNECIVTRKFTVDEMLSMEPEKLDRLLNPIRVGNINGTRDCSSGLCKLESDVCMPICLNDTNIHLLKDSIVYTVACHSSEQLGRCAIQYGVQSYVGYKDLLLFPVDQMKSQDIFGEIHLSFLRELLMGKSVGEASENMNSLETAYIRAYKQIKWVGLPLLWNFKHREILGYPNAMIY